MKVLIEASTTMLDSRDGSQRYVLELLRGLLPIVKQPDSPWEIDVHLGMRHIVSLRDAEDIVQSVFPRQSAVPQSRTTHGANASFSRKLVLRLKSSLFNTILALLPEALVSVLQQWNRSLQSMIWARLKPIDFDQYDLVHLTLPQFYNTLADCSVKLVTTVFDLSHLHYPQFHMKNNIVCTEKGMRFAIARQSNFIAISEATRRDVLAHYPGVHHSAICTVYPGCHTDSFFPVTDPVTLERVREKYKLPQQPYFVSLSTLEPRKNLINSIRAFLQLLENKPELDVCFVIAGKKGWKFKDVFDAAEQSLDRIIFTGFIDEEDLPAVFSGALALSYVSYYEGFGLPPVEAMSCGIPVIYGDNSSMPEVIEDGGLPADPDDVDAIAGQLMRVAMNAPLRNELAAHALRQARKFSWGKMAHETLATYETFIKEAS